MDQVPEILRKFSLMLNGLQFYINLFMLNIFDRHFQWVKNSFSLVVVVFCIDEHVNCNFWASQGDCKKTPDYMLIGCRKACHDCGNSWNYNQRETRKIDYILFNCSSFN